MTTASPKNMDPALATALRESAASKAAEELREAGFSASTGYVNGREGFRIHCLRGDLDVVIELTDEKPAMMLVGLTPVPAPSAESAVRSTKPDAADSGARPVKPCRWDGIRRFSAQIALAAATAGVLLLTALIGGTP